MGVVSELVREELVDLSCQLASIDEFFDRKAHELGQLGYVEESYRHAVTEREKEYPTGLQLEFVAIAIPHTTVEHIKKPFIYFNKLTEESLEFIQMGTDDVVVKPKYILMLGIKEPKEQVTLLAELMELFSHESFVEAIQNAQSVEEVLNIFRNN